MKKLAVSALALTLGTGMASAQVVYESPLGGMDYEGYQQLRASGDIIRASEIEDTDIYTVSGDAGYDWGVRYEYYEGVGEGWEDIGEIEEVLLDSEGQMIGVSAEIGGWLGIGDTEVFLPLDDVQFGPIRDAGNMIFVTRLTQEQLEALPNIDEGFWNTGYGTGTVGEPAGTVGGTVGTVGEPVGTVGGTAGEPVEGVTEQEVIVVD